jgi:hypothetical protein
MGKTLGRLEATLKKMGKQDLNEEKIKCINIAVMRPKYNQTLDLTDYGKHISL